MAVVSSCREMSGLVLQRAKPLSLVASIQLGTLERPPVLNRRKAGTTSSHHGLYAWLHTCYNGWDKGTRTREREQISKTYPQFRLQAAIRLHEAGIASNRRSAMLR